MTLNAYGDSLLRHTASIELTACREQWIRSRGSGAPHIEQSLGAEGRDRVTDIELRSLAPEYDENHHQTYVSRLNAAVSDPRNKNIALTGRYGAGKSSILDKFIKDQETPETEDPGNESSEKTAKTTKKKRKKASSKKVLRISINTLGPDNDEDLTNRIQKELVKQLVYRAKPGEVRSSEFARTPPLRWWRAALDALAVAVVLVGLLWLFGLRPIEDSFGTDNSWLPMAALFFLLLGILWAIRWYIGNRVVAQVSAGGASIALEGKSDSFFDKYLDELITFFEATEPDIVVFEDLDRFDDPRIFDSLRELNTLVNSSAHWRNRPDRPLRFVYAIKDSLFEKLGDKQREKDKPDSEQNENSTSRTSRSAPEKKEEDTAAAAVERANRTKFFEIVVPVVSFLSHSNARDHFLNELGRLRLPKGTHIAHGLIDIVARHTTDMRLMINIGNEFVVYAERLLWVDADKLAPGLTADKLFALVVYKNFHLADFEDLPHRGSALDSLDNSRRDLVDESIKNLRSERSDLISGVTRLQKQRDLSAQLSKRLEVLQKAARMTLKSAKVGNNMLDAAATDEPTFWQPIGISGSVKMNFQHHSGHTEVVQFDRSELGLLFPEVSDPASWLELPPSDASRLREIDAEIATLRGADFKSLMENERYKFKDRTFRVIAEHTLPSKLAIDIVEQGYIDRFYAEYATVFYGHFLGVDVANFFRNSVWPNEMDAQFEFTTPGAVANVLAQAPADFLGTRSALNIDIVNHLMTVDASRSIRLIDFLARPHNADGHQFLSIYLNTPTSLGEDLVSRLAAKPWSALFSFIASEGMIDGDETILSLLNAALRSAPSFETFELDDDARSLIARLHSEIPAFCEAQRGVPIKTLFAFLTAALPSVPNLRTLSTELRNLVVDAKRYTLDPSNLRAAATLPDETPLSADNLLAKTLVWEYCTENVEGYLSLVESDEQTTGSCATPEVLTQIVNAQHEKWSGEQMDAFLDASAESAALPDITVVEQTAWTTVVDRLRVVPNFTNLDAYANEIGVDDALAALLTDDDGAVIDIINVEDATKDHLELLGTLLLNAHAVLEPRQRVLLAKQMLRTPHGAGFDLSEIEATPDELLAELLRDGMIGDTAEDFAHFSGAGWPSIGPALRVSTNAATFITPALIQGHAEEIVRGNSFPEATRRALLERLVEFAPTEDQSFLIATASAARTLRVSLPTDALMLIAPTVHDHEDVVWQLKEQAGRITESTAMQILGNMSGDFVGFSGTTGQQFDVRDTPSLKVVLDRLKHAGKIVLQPGRQPKGRWKLRIS